MYEERADLQEREVTLNLVSGEVRRITASSFDMLLTICWTLAPDDAVDLQMISVSGTRVGPINWKQHPDITLAFMSPLPYQERRSYNDRQVTYEELAAEVPPSHLDETWEIIGRLDRK